MENQKNKQNNQLETLAESSISAQEREDEIIDISQSLEEVFEEEKKQLISIRKETQLSEKSVEQPLSVVKYWGEKFCWVCQDKIGVGALTSLQKMWTKQPRTEGMIYKGKEICMVCWKTDPLFDDYFQEKHIKERRSFIARVIDKLDDENQISNTSNLFRKLQAREEARETIWEIEKMEIMDDKKIIERNLEKAFWRERKERERERMQKDEEIGNLTEIIKEGKEEAENLTKEREKEKEKWEKEQQQREREEVERKAQQKKLLESQNQLHSPDKVDLEALKIKHQQLELKAKTNQEILDFYKVKIDDYKLAIEQLKEEREREEQEKGRFLALYVNENESLSNEKKLHLLTKKINLSEKGNLKQNIAELQIEWNAAKREKENQKKDYERKLETKQIELDTSEYEKSQERKDYEQAKQEWKNKMDERLAQIYKEIDKNTKLEIETAAHRTTINQLIQENQVFKQEKEAAEEKLTQETRKKRVGNLLAVGVLASEYLPLPKKWNSTIKHGFEAGQLWVIASDIPNAAYEGIIGLTAVMVFFLLRKIKRRLFGRKEINQVQELRTELMEARSKVLMLKDEKKEAEEKSKELAAKLIPPQGITVNPVNPINVNPVEPKVEPVEPKKEAEPTTKKEPWKHLTTKAKIAR